MSLSDCAQCWDTPCQCGHSYRNWPLSRLEEFAKMIQGVIDEKRAQGTQQPTVKEI